VPAPLTRQRPFIIKIGGSLAASALLPQWLQAIGKIPGQPIVVPGGGPFADAVRAAQNDMGFDDLAAHRMALFAMEQYGLALAAMAPRLSLAATPAAIRRAWRLGEIPIWAPAHMLGAATAVPPSWDATSDTLSAWLAHELGATKLLLIKSADPPQGAPLTLADLAASGVVDRLFPAFAGTSGAEIFIAGPSALEGAGPVFAAGGVPGTRTPLS
jgi:5-(aminomethyl)-3-furanmethanol phosphate kinase